MLLLKSIMFSALLLLVTAGIPAMAAEELSGDSRLACEALLCLSSGERPGECSPSLDRYFGITREKWSDTLKARKSFLNQCPASSEAGMPGLVEAIVNGAGQCSAALLNRVLAHTHTELVCDDNQYWDTENWCHDVLITVIDDCLPPYCRAYTSHEWTWKLGVRYEGDPMRGGKWIDAQ